MIRIARLALVSCAAASASAQGTLLQHFPGTLPADRLGWSLATPGDLDGDGVADVEDGDLDGDGIGNSEERDVDGDGVDDYGDTDLNGDGVDDAEQEGVAIPGYVRPGPPKESPDLAVGPLLLVVAAVALLGRRRFR